MKILDLGCGFGSSTEIVRIFNQNTIGIDIAYNWLKYSKKSNPDYEIILADCQKIPLKDESIDTIVSWGLFEFIDRRITIKEIFRILKDQGICIILVPNKHSAYRYIPKTISKIFGKKYEKYEPSKKEMILHLIGNGFDLIEFYMNDGLIWLPDQIDKIVGEKLYLITEQVIKIKSENPLSNDMLLVAMKVK